MDIIIPVAIIGIISSIIVELFKLIPTLSKTDLRKQITAFVVTLFAVLVYVFVCGDVVVDGFVNFVGFLALSLTTTYGVYKTVLKGLQIPLKGLRKIVGI